MRKPLALFAPCLFFGIYPLALAAKHSEPPLLNPSEVHAELLTRLYVNKLNAGDPVLAKVIDPWEGRNCKLRDGAILAGHVVKAETSNWKNVFSSITITFDTAECNDLPSAALPLTLVTILPSANGGDSDELESRSLIDALFSPENVITSYERALDNKGDLANELNRATTFSDQANAQLPAGRVVGFHLMQLDAGVGPENASRVYRKDKNLRLERRTNMILVPSPKMDSASTVVPSPAIPVDGPKTVVSTTSTLSSHALEANIATAPPPQPEPIDETDICSSVCNTVGEITGRRNAKASDYRLSIASLGFSTNLNRVIDSFGYDSTLTYLDDSNLLLTFAPHQLRHRIQIGIRREPARMVRAVLINPKTHAVKHVYEWEVYGQGQYLWPAGQGRVLVHINQQLSLLGPDLKPIHSFPLDGVFHWASVSPSGDHFVVGTIRERHTEALHRLILESTGIEPEEDVDVTLYDGEFKSIFATTRSSTDRPTILSDHGELRLHSTDGRHWQLDEERWDRSSRRLISSTSYCRPTISAQNSGHLFLSGCSDYSGLRWYRMLRSDGHPVVKTRASSGEIEHSADTTASSAFAVRVVKTKRPLYPGKAFNRVDLDSEEVNVYRTKDGHQIFSASSGDMPLTVQSFALSPTGRQVVLLDGKFISFYGLDETPAQP
jgi:hypothetical protein